MILIQKTTGKKFDVDLRKASGEEVALCPVCSHDRKKKTAKCLGFNHNMNVGRCNHCHEAFYSESNEKRERSEPAYKRPEWSNSTQLSDSVVKWFEGRGIRQNTLSTMKVSEGLAWMPQTGKEENTIQFNYFRGDELINIKYRDGRKNFRLFKDAELILYNLNAVAKETVIVEGEIDCLAFIQAGVGNCVSVPNGAGKNPNLQYIDNSFDVLETVETFYICTDGDEAGRMLRDELIRRLGEERCRLIDLKDCKDANEYLIKYGAIELAATITNATPCEISGIITADSQRAEVHDLFNNGMPSGDTIRIPEFDELISFVVGYTTTLTGIPSHGKSEVLDEIMVRLAHFCGWKFAIYSPENMPFALHIIKLAEKLTALSAKKKFSEHERMSSMQLDSAIDWITKHFYFVRPKDEDFSADSILNHAKKLVRSAGIKGVVIDPWNRLEHLKPKGVSDTDYVGQSLDKIDLFNIKNGTHTFLVVHPRKMNKQKDNPFKYEVPTLYDCNGSANFYNKSANGISVYRNFEESNTTTEVHVMKVKFNHWGKIGSVAMNYDMRCGRFTPIQRQYDRTNWLLNEPQQTALIPNTEFLNPIITNTNANTDEYPF